MSRPLRFRSGLLSRPVLDSTIPSRRTSLDKNSDSIFPADDDLFHNFNSDNNYDGLANVDDKSVSERDLLDAVGYTLGNAADGLGDIADTGVQVVSAVGDVATSAVGEVVSLVDNILSDGVSIVKSVATGALPSIISHLPSIEPSIIIPPLSSIISLPPIIPTKDPLPSWSVSVDLPLPTFTLPTDLPPPTVTVDSTILPSFSINNESPPPEATRSSFSLPPSSLSIGSELPPVTTATHKSSISSDATTSIPHIVTSTTVAHTTLSNTDSSTVTTMLPSQSSSKSINLNHKSFSNYQYHASNNTMEGDSPPSGYTPDGNPEEGGRPNSGPPTPPNPTGSPGTLNPATPQGAAGIVIGTLVFFLVFAAVGLFWWKRRQNKKGVDMLGRRLELADTPDAWERIEGGEAFGGAEKRRTKEGYRHGYGTIRSGRTQQLDTVKGGGRRHLPIITPLLRWVQARSQSSPHGKTGSTEYAASKGSLPRIRTQVGRRSLSPGSLPSSENASLRSGSFLSSHENDISLYMYPMSDGEDTPLPSPRSLSSMVSQLSRNPSSSSTSTDNGSEDSYNPIIGEGKDRSRRRRDSESSEETLDTRSSFGFVRPVVSTTAGTTPSIFTATGHYIMANSSTTTLHTPYSPASPSPSPRTSTRENSSNLGSPYGPGQDFFTARAWRKSQNAGPSLMEVVNSLSPTDSDMQRRNGNDLENRF